MNKIYICTDHDSFWIDEDCKEKGVSIIAAKDEQQARATLDAELIKNGLLPHIEKGYTLQEVDVSKVMALILNDGDY